jgi:4-carboxymuconolactone decarboxylase
VLPRPDHPRIAPLTDEEKDDDVVQLLGEVGALTGMASNIFATLVRHPGLFRKWLPFGGKLLAGKLPARDRELLILRTAWHTRSPYEWGQHVGIGKSSGLTDDEIARVPLGPSAPGWDDWDTVLLTAADELHTDACVGDVTWEALAERYDDRQLIEVPFVVGHYHMVAFALNTLGVQREDGVPGLPEEPM